MTIADALFDELAQFGEENGKRAAASDHREQTVFVGKQSFSPFPFVDSGDTRHGFRASLFAFKSHGGASLRRSPQDVQLYLGIGCVPARHVR